MSLAPARDERFPLQIIFRGIDHSSAIESAIRRQAAQLERFRERVTRFQVTVDMPQRHRHAGNHYGIRIEIKTPSGEVFVTRDPDLAQKDFQAVLRAAFEAAVCHLENDRPRHRVGSNTDEPLPRGRVTQLFVNAGCGFLETAGGDELYFNTTSVSEADRLRLIIGSRVSFTIIAEEGDLGARAAHVELLAEENDAHPGDSAPAL